MPFLRSKCAPSSTHILQFWIKCQSQVVQLNMAPYYQAWGWPVTAATEAALASLPTYQLPAYSPPSPPPSPAPPSPPAPPLAPSSISTADYQALAAGVGAIATGERVLLSECHGWRHALCH